MKKIFLILLTLLNLPLGVKANSNPPYEFYSYVAGDTDNPPINYTKVCEPIWKRRRIQLL